LELAASLSDLKPCVPQNLFVFISPKQVDFLMLNTSLQNCWHSDLEVGQKCPQGDVAKGTEDGKTKTFFKR